MYVRFALIRLVMNVKSLVDTNFVKDAYQGG